MREVMAFLLAATLLFGITVIPALAENTSATIPIKNPISVPGHLAPVYGFSGAEKPVEDSQDQSEAPEIRSLGLLPTSSPGTQIGYTTYDAQHNCTMARQIEHRGTDYLSRVWTLKTNETLGGARYIGLNQLSLTTCALNGSGFANATRAGYTGVDVDPATGCPIITGHEAFSGDNYPTAYFNLDCPPNPASPSFTPDYPRNNFGYWINEGVGPGNENIWPKIEWQEGSQTILHMMAAESGGGAGAPRTISYYRKQFNGYGDDGGNDWKFQKVIDTVLGINVTIAASPYSDQVAIVWAAPCDYKRDTPDEFTSLYTNDIWYVICDDQGFGWTTSPTAAGAPSIAWEVDQGFESGGNITNYSATDDYKAYCDLSAIFDAQDDLHIVWNARHWSNNGADLDLRNSALFHWGQGDGVITPMVIADWDDGLGVGHAWGSDVAKPSISICDGKLYVLYAQFGNAANPSGDRDATNDIVNGELYLAISDDGGLSWGTPQNLTNSETPGCAAGDCDSDYWPSMARYGRPANGCGGGDDVPTDGYVLDILYINDKEPGAVVQPESSTWTENPVMWLTVPCRGANEIDCGNPIMVDLSTDLPYSDINTTCGRGYSVDLGTCLNEWDNGEDIFYQLTVTSEMDLDFLLDPRGTAWTGMALSEYCPQTSCIATSTPYSSDPHGFSVTLAPGTYYLTIDGYPPPDCIPDFELTITEILVGACCLEDGSCSELMEVDCELAGGTFQGNESVCAGDNNQNGVDDLCEGCDPNDQWPTYAHDYSRTSQSGISLGDITGLTRQWVYKVQHPESGQINFTSPVIANDIVFVSSYKGLHAIDLLTGTLIWDTFTHPDYNEPLEFYGLSTSPTVDMTANRVYFGTGTSAGFVCADATTGDTIWVRANDLNPLPGTPRTTSYANSVIIGDAIYFGDADGQIYALNKNTGAGLYYADLGVHVETSPSHAVVDIDGTPTDMLFFGTKEFSSGLGSIYGIEPTGTDFNIIWEYVNPDNATLEDGFEACPVFYKGNLLAHASVDQYEQNNGYDGYRINLDPATGNEIWSDYEMGEPLHSTPAVFNGVAYFGSDQYWESYALHPDGNNFKAVDIATNSIIWQNTASNESDQNPTHPSLSCDPYVFSGTRSKKWRIHDAETGELQIQYHMKYNFWCGTAIAHGSDGKDYAVTADQLYVYAFAVEETDRSRMHIPELSVRLDPIPSSETELVQRSITPVGVANYGDGYLSFTAILTDGAARQPGEGSESQAPPNGVTWVWPYVTPYQINVGMNPGPNAALAFNFEIDPTALSVGDNTFYVEIGSNDPDFAPWEDPQPEVQATMTVIVELTNFTCGDANGDDAVNVGDAVKLINYIFKGGTAPDPLGAGEVNCDGSVNVGDAVYIINYVFKGGNPPCFSCP